MFQVLINRWKAKVLRSIYGFNDKVISAAFSFNYLAQTRGLRVAAKRSVKKILSARQPIVNAEALFTDNKVLATGNLMPRESIFLESWSHQYLRRNPDLRSFPAYLRDGEGESFTSLVTDSIGASSLFGGVGTALIFSTLLANRRGQPLRIITRTEPGSSDMYGTFLKTHGIHLENELIIDYAPREADNLVVGYNSKDIFITTSWWTTASCLQRLPAHLIVYLIQEDERYFYPYGSKMIDCQTIMAHPGIKFVVNSKLLWDHFCTNSLINIQENGLYFEPCFRVQCSESLVKQPGKKTLFFYARPNNPRNLYGIGMQALNKALLDRVIDPSLWDIALVGSNLEPICFDDGTIPRLVEGLSWADYLNFIRNVDIGLSLMATPHPSYPPLDLAASGAVVVTNSFGNKVNLDMYSKNILCCSPSVDGIVKALGNAIVLVNNPKIRNDHILSQNFNQCWSQALMQVIESHSFV